MAKKYVQGKAEKLGKNQVRVQSGDSLWKLAEKYTGSGTNWSKLNGGKKLIKPGDIIDIPENLWNPEINAASKKEKYETRRKEIVSQAGKDIGGGVKAGQTPRGAVTQAPALPVQTLPYYNQWSGYPGLWMPQLTPEPVIPYRAPEARIETTDPGQLSLSELFIKYNVAPGDTLVMPNGEMIKNVPGADAEWRERYFDIESKNTYDDNSEDVTQQKNVPSASFITFGKKSVGKYTPAVPKDKKRGNKYYPKKVEGKAKNKPIQYKQEGGGLIKSLPPMVQGNIKQPKLVDTRNRIYSKDFSFRKNGPTYFNEANRLDSLALDLKSRLKNNKNNKLLFDLSQIPLMKKDLFMHQNSNMNYIKNTKLAGKWIGQTD